jgi:hypothetical protein
MLTVANCGLLSGQAVEGTCQVGARNGSTLSSDIYCA